MPHITHYLPELQEPERTYIQSLIGRMSHEQIQVFASAYRSEEKIHIQFFSQQSLVWSQFQAYNVFGWAKSVWDSSIFSLGGCY